MRFRPWPVMNAVANERALLCSGHKGPIEGHPERPRLNAVHDGPEYKRQKALRTRLLVPSLWDPGVRSRLGCRGLCRGRPVWVASTSRGTGARALVAGQGVHGDEGGPINEVDEPGAWARGGEGWMGVCLRARLGAGVPHAKGLRLIVPCVRGGLSNVPLPTRRPPGADSPSFRRPGKGPIISLWWQALPPPPPLRARRRTGPDRLARDEHNVRRRAGARQADHFQGVEQVPATAAGCGGWRGEGQCPRPCRTTARCGLSEGASLLSIPGVRSQELLRGWGLRAPRRPRAGG